MDSSTAGNCRISLVTGEFEDARTEAEYQRRRSAVTARHAIVAILVAALFFLAFSITDWLAVGATPALTWLVAARFGVLTFGLAVALWIHLSPAAAGRGRAASLFEIAAFTAFWLVIAVRSEPVEVYGMSMVAMLAAVYLVIPNRPLYTLAIGVFATVGFAALIVNRTPASVTSSVDVLMLLILVNTFGYIAAHRLAIARRQEFRLLIRAEQANERLAEEIKRRRRLERELRRLATTDGLTGLCNRRHFMEMSRHALQRAARTKEPVAVLLLDVDYFKRVNDTFGHSIGDKALMTVAQVLRQELRATDIVARFGGEEFAVTLPDAPLERARAVAERIRSALAEECVPGAPAEYRLTATLGVAAHDGRDESMEALLNRADRALYEGKSTGRNRVVVVGPVAVRNNG